jgi:hypothetical protein
VPGLPPGVTSSCTLPLEFALEFVHVLRQRTDGLLPPGLEPGDGRLDVLEVLLQFGDAPLQFVPLALEDPDGVQLRPALGLAPLVRSRA